MAVVDAVHRQLDSPLEQAERRPREKAAEKNLFELPMGAMKQAQPSCKHMFTGVGGVKTARVFGRVC